MKHKQYIFPLISLLVVLGIWEAAVYFMEIPAYVLPTPHGILGAMASDLPNLWMHSMVTLQEAVWGLLIAAALADGECHLKICYEKMEKAEAKNERGRILHGLREAFGAH